MESKKILVTGGAGFIGTNLVNELRKRGHEVLALDLYNTERDNYIRADVRNFRQLERVLRNQGLTMSTTLPPNMAGGMVRIIMRISGRPMLSEQNICSVSRKNYGSG